MAYSRHKNFDSLLKEFWIKRLAQSSTVAVFKTSDPKRLHPFIDFIRTSYEKLIEKGTVKSYKMYVYRVWSGLYEARYVRDSGKEVLKFLPVTVRIQQQLPPMLQVASPQQHIKDLPTALSYVDGLMNQKEDEAVILILWGLFPKKGAPQEQDALISFLRNAIFTDSYYSKFHTVVLFSDSPDALIDDDTLKHSIYIEISPSIDEERQSLISNIVNEFGSKITNGVDISQLVEALSLIHI